MAYKDEYEVARLYSDGSFAEKLSKQFTGDFTLDGEEWAQFATSGTLWLLLPLALGIWRLLRSEVK